MLADLVRLHNEKPEWKVTYVFGIAMTNFGGGHDTITASLTAILTCVCQDERHVARIWEEIVVVGEIHRYQVVAKLRFLHACMKEAMRLFPVVGQSMPRVVPADVSIDGHALPAGTVVGLNPYVLNFQKIDARGGCWNL